MKKKPLGQNDKLIGRPIRLNRQHLHVKQDRDFAEVMFLGDVHYGSPQCDIDRFLANVEYCEKNNAYAFLMGDLVESATRDSVGAGVYEQEETVDKQHTQMVEWLTPLADKKLILGSHAGNHEARISDRTGFNISKALSRELKIPYLGDACWSHFKVGSQTYTLYTLHGRTGSRFDGTALLALERISTSFFCDMLAMGHTHKCINSIVLIQKVVNARVTEHKKHLLITGAYLKYDRGYGQTLGLPISKLGSPTVRFYADRHDITISW